MNLKMIGLMLVLLALLIIGWYKIGLALTLFIFAWISLIDALISNKKEGYYDAFMKFMNPKFYKKLEGKGEEFVLKNRKWSIRSLYGLSACIFFNSFMMYLIGKMTDDRVSGHNIEVIISIGIVSFIFVVPLIFLNNIILKKARTAD
jgi:hypothetical protein